MQGIKGNWSIFTLKLKFEQIGAFLQNTLNSTGMNINCNIWNGSKNKDKYNTTRQNKKKVRRINGDEQSLVLW